MVLNLYQVDMITDLDEQVSAYGESEALAIGITMLENGELECAGPICASAATTLL